MTEWWKRADGTEIPPLWGLVPFEKPQETAPRRAVIGPFFAGIGIGFVLAGLLVAAVVLTPPCRPGDRGLYIGGAMLIAGCPR